MDRDLIRCYNMQDELVYRVVQPLDGMSTKLRFKCLLIKFNIFLSTPVSCDGPMMRIDFDLIAFGNKIKVIEKGPLDV